MEQHTHEHTKAVLNRMSRAIKSEITGVSKVILKDHIDHCIVDAVKENDEDAIEQLKGAIDKLL